MFIVVKHLHANITVDILENFVKPVLTGRIYHKPAILKAIQIIGLVDRRGIIHQRHSLIRVAPDSQKNRIIKSLQNKSMAEDKFPVAEYIIRHWSNDRRHSKHAKCSSTTNRRISDRRRTDLRIVNIEDRVYG